MIVRVSEVAFTCSVCESRREWIVDASEASNDHLDLTCYGCGTQYRVTRICLSIDAQQVSTPEVHT